MKLNPKYNERYGDGAGGARLFVEENGDPTKPAILWIHGYSQCRLSWDNQFENEDLVSKFHMISLDLRGHGLSDKLSDPAAFQDGKIWAEDIRAVISTLRLNKLVLVGWSYGGHIICDNIRHYGQEEIWKAGHVGTYRSVPCVAPTDIMRTLQVDDNPTRLAQAIAEFGQIDKTLHTLNMIDDENKRRSTLTKEELLYSFC
jgi:alpha-beta hydrolase superfamily lysophospholipase